LRGRLGADPLAEALEPLLAAAVRDDALDRRHRRANRGDLALGLPAAADHAQRSRPRARQVLGRDAARSAGPELPEPVRLDHGDELGAARLEEEDDEADIRVAERGVGLEAGVAELSVGRRHHGEDPAFESEPVARPVLDASRGEPPERTLDRLERVLRRQQRLDVRLRQVQRHARTTTRPGSTRTMRSHAT
jgi:hypothetical protein